MAHDVLWLSMCSDQPVIASAFVDLAQICILTSVANSGFGHFRIC